MGWYRKNIIVSLYSRKMPTWCEIHFYFCRSNAEILLYTCRTSVYSKV